jgi:TP901 family phage tail tape measure protein
MSSVSTKWILELVDEITAPLKSIDGNASNVAKETAKVNKQLRETSAIDISAISDSFRSLNNRLNEFVSPGQKFQDQLAEVEAITGVTGDALDKLGGNARKSAKRFGGEASDSLNNYKVILSKLGPDIGKNDKALGIMNNNVLTLSKTMDNDAPGAVAALTTSMLQFRVDLNDPIKAAGEMTNMMNVMAAGAKEGAAEVPDISQSIKVAGVAASEANVSFVETNSAIQELARGGKKGAEGGTALRNVLTKMSGADILPKRALAKLKAYGVDMSIVSNKTLPFTTRLRELAKAQGDATIFAQMFGVENAAAANILVRSVDEQDALSKKIANTNTATEQAAVIMGTHSEKMKRWSSFFSDLGISMFNGTKGFLPFVNGAFGAVDVLADLKNAQKGVAMIMDTKLGKGLKFIGSGFKKGGAAALGFLKNVALSGVTALKSSGRFVITALTGIGSYVASLITATAAQLGLNVAMSANPIGLIVIGIAAVIGIIALFITYWDEIKSAIVSFAKFVWKVNPFRFIIDLVDKVFPGFKDGIKEIFSSVVDWFVKMWDGIKDIWNSVTGFFGFGDNEAEITVKKVGEDDPETDPSKIPDSKKTLPIITNPLAPNSQTNTANGISGSGAGKSIVMNLDIKNYFNMAAGNWRESTDEIVNVVVGKITDRMRDSVVALE